MKRRLIIGFLVLLFLAVLPYRSPAPLTYRPGEGWTYDAVGGGKWERTRAKDQFEVAQEAFDHGNYSLALKAARRTVLVWSMSDYAPKAQYLAGRCYEAKGQLERAFKEYQKLVEKYPKADIYQDVVQRQFAIANQYLAGRWFRLWNYIPFFPSMDKTVEYYDQIIRNGPFNIVAPQAQMNIGKAREKQKDYFLAVKAYERAADRYHDMKGISADAVFKAGMAYFKQAETAEYDQSVAGNAISTFSDFITLFPNDPRVSEADKIISKLKTEQARGALTVARFYEKNRKWDGALVYYNEVLVRDPESKFAVTAKKKIEDLKKKASVLPAPSTPPAQPEKK